MTFPFVSIVPAPGSPSAKPAGAPGKDSGGTSFGELVADMSVVAAGGAGAPVRDSRARGEEGHTDDGADTAPPFVPSTSVMAFAPAGARWPDVPATDGMLPGSGVAVDVAVAPGVTPEGATVSDGSVPDTELPGASTTAVPIGVPVESQTGDDGGEAARVGQPDPSARVKAAASVDSPPHRESRAVPTTEIEPMLEQRGQALAASRAAAHAAVTAPGREVGGLLVVEGGGEPQPPVPDVTSPAMRVAPAPEPVGAPKMPVSLPEGSDGGGSGALRGTVRAEGTGLPGFEGGRLPAGPQAAATVFTSSRAGVAGEVGSQTTVQVAKPPVAAPTDIVPGATTAAAVPVVAGKHLSEADRRFAGNSPPPVAVAATDGSRAEDLLDDQVDPVSERTRDVLSRFGGTSPGDDRGRAVAETTMWQVDPGRSGSSTVVWDGRALVSDLIRPLGPVAAYQGADVPAGSMPAGTLAARAEVPQQVIRAMRLQWSQGVGEARLRLHPGQLGEVTITLKVEGGQVAASLRTETAAAQQWIETHQHDLRTALKSQGLELSSFVVRRDRDEDSRQRQPDKDADEPRRRREPPPSGEEPRFEVIV